MRITRRRFGIWLPVSLGSLGSGSMAAAATIDDAPVRRWVARAGELKSVAADFRQERYLRALTKPLITPGKLWYRADGAMRWQIGEPPKTIALRLRAGAHVTVLEPAAKIRRSFSAEQAGMSGGAIALLDAGFPESYEAFEKRFRVEAVDRDEAGAWRVTAQPRDPALTVAVQRMVFRVDAETSHLRGIEIWLRDGSRIENHFTALTENAPVPDSLFKEAAEGYRDVK